MRIAQHLPITEINNADDASAFVQHLITVEIGVGYHPDTPFTEYRSISNWLPLYSQEDAAIRQMLSDRMFDVVDDPSELCLDVMTKWLDGKLGRVLTVGGAL